MRSEDTPFVGGPLDGRILPVLLGPTGHPPKVYRVPVPDATGGPPTVLVYRRVPGAPGKRLGLRLSWTYAYDPDTSGTGGSGGTSGSGGGGPRGGGPRGGGPRGGGPGGGGRLKWPWSKPSGGG